MNQATIDKAKNLGFKVSEKLEYRLDTDTGIDNGERVAFWNVIFPPDYPNQHPHAIHDDKDLEFLIKQYLNRTEDAKRDIETSRQTVEAMKKLGERFKL